MADWHNSLSFKMALHTVQSTFTAATFCDQEMLN